MELFEGDGVLKLASGLNYLLQRSNVGSLARALLYNVDRC